MIIVKFEIIIKKEFSNNYLAEAEKLFPLLKNYDGFIDVERYRSIKNPNKVISISKWKNIESVNEWKKNSLHKASQKLGKRLFFEYYTIYVSEVIYDYNAITSKI